MTGKIFNSIHIDLEKGIFEINGEEMKYVKDISLKSEGKNWLAWKYREMNTTQNQRGAKNYGINFDKKSVNSEKLFLKRFSI